MAAGGGRLVSERVEERGGSNEMAALELASLSRMLAETGRKNKKGKQLEEITEQSDSI